MTITINIPDVLFYTFSTLVFIFLWGMTILFSLALRWGEDTNETREIFIAILCSIPTILLYLCFFYVKFVFIW